MSNLKKTLWAAALLGLVICGFFAYYIYNAVFRPNTAFQNDQAYVFIPSNSTFKDVKEMVKPLLKDIGTFQAVAERKGFVSNIKGGKYTINKGMSNNAIINSLRSRNIPVKVTFNNQERLADLAGRVADQLEMDSLSLLTVMSNLDFLGENGFSAETALGMYLPNTYEFFWNTTANAFCKRMKDEYERFWTNERLEKCKKLGLSQNEVITLASIVQKETIKVDERPRVAGVYLNRLRKQMLLQADPTVIFAIKKITQNYDTLIKRVLYRDLEIDSPYNTYLYPSLPPGPICMPDISSIKAVLNPESHNYLYFVADVQNFGYHKFAKTLKQHNLNKQQYIKWLNNQNINR